MFFFLFFFNSSHPSYSQILFYLHQAELLKRPKWSGRESEKTKEMDNNYDQNVEKTKLWYKQKPTESTKSCSQLLSENNIVLFGCGQSRISLSAPHWELWYQPNPRGNEKRQGYKQRLACLFVMRRKTAVSLWSTGFLVLEQRMYSIANCVH